MDKWMPNVAKHLEYAGYQTAMVGKWHLGEGTAHEPQGFDYWFVLALYLLHVVCSDLVCTRRSVLPGQGIYYDPVFIEPNGRKVVNGYVTDIITDKTIDFLSNRDKDKPFFIMCHHKAPHRSWE